MVRILVIISNPRQASYRLWIEPLKALLPKRGIELDVRVRPGGIWARCQLLRQAGGYYAVLLFRKLLDPGDAWLLRRHARRIVFALDDAVMYHAHPVGWLSRWRTRRRFEATARIVDHVVAGNEYLADFFRQRGRATTVLPAYLDSSRYEMKRHREGERPALVWIGSKSTLPYLEAAMPAIREAASRVPLRLITVADAGLNCARDGSLEIEHVPWSEQTESSSLLRGDIGIAPTPDNPWTRGKCGFKIIQYMAAGLPAIASPVGANGRIIVPGETGFLASTSDDWTDAIEKLSRDATMRRRLGEAGRRRVESEHALTRALENWARILRE